jgi:hypothetical protein
MIGLINSFWWTKLNLFLENKFFKLSHTDDFSSSSQKYFHSLAAMSLEWWFWKFMQIFSFLICIFNQLRFSHYTSTHFFFILIFISKSLIVSLVIKKVKKGLLLRNRFPMLIMSHTLFFLTLAHKLCFVWVIYTSLISYNRIASVSIYM